MSRGLFSLAPLAACRALLVAGTILAAVTAQAIVDDGGSSKPPDCQPLLAASSPRANLKATEQEHQTAAELLLLLIFDHPMLKEVIQRPTTSDEEVRDLFHAVNGFMIMPLNPDNYGAREFDPSGFYRRISFPHSTPASVTLSRPQSWIRRLLSKASSVSPRYSAHHEATKLSEFYNFMSMPFRYDQWKPERKTRFAEDILESSCKVWWSFVFSAKKAQERVPQLLDFPPCQIDFKIQRNGDFNSDVKVLVPDFRAFHMAEIQHLERLIASLLGRERGIPYNIDGMWWRATPTHNLMSDWLQEYLPFVVQLHEDLLHAAQGDVGKKRSVLLADRPLQVFLRDQILRWSQGDYTRRERRQSNEDSLPIKGLSSYLPRLATTPPPLLVTEIRQSLSSDSESTDISIFDQGRTLMQKWDQLMLIVPALPRFDRLKSWNENLHSFSSWRGDLAAHLNDLVVTNQKDLQTLVEIHQTALLIEEKFAVLEQNLPPATKDGDVNANEEWQTWKLLRRQGLEVLRLREGNQRRGLEAVIQTQTILR